jgi:hypothetical protein
LNEPQAGHLLLNILAKNERLEDIVAGLSFENKFMSSRLQLDRVTNSQLQQEQKEEQGQ